MKPLTTNQRILTLLSFPVDQTLSWRDTLISLILIPTMLASNVISIYLTVLYFLNFKSIDLEKSLYAVFQMGASLHIISAIIIILLSRYKLSAIFEHLQKIYDSYADELSFRFLAKANNMCEKIWEFYFKFAIGGYLAASAIVYIISILICKLIHGHFDTEYVYHPVKYVTPWNQETLFGYSIEILLNFVSPISYLLYTGALLLLFISICLHYRAFYEQQQYSLFVLDFPGIREDYRDFFFQLTHSHEKIKDWFAESADLYNPYITAQTICSMSMLACVFFQIDLELKHIDFNIGILLMAVMNSILNLFLFSFFGKLATESFAEMADLLFESNWQSLPIQFQKYFIILIGNAQKPLVYKGFGIVALNLETFARILKTVFTYYMMFKAMAND